MYYVYKLFFPRSGKAYVGFTANLKQRLAAHRCKGVLPMHEEPTISVLQLVEGNRADALEVEQAHIEREKVLWPNGFNMKGFGAVNAMHGDTKRLISEKARGHKRWLGKQHTAETRALFSAQRSALAAEGRWGAKKGRVVTEETKAKIAAAQRGKPCPYKGMKRDPAIGEKIGAALRGKIRGPNGRVYTEEEKAALSAKIKGYKHTPEARAKMREGRAERNKKAWITRRKNAANKKP